MTRSLAARGLALLPLRGSGSAAGRTRRTCVDIGGFQIQLADLLIALYFLGFFVLGFAQGTIRRLLGIGSILFSWFLAANIAEPLGTFLGQNWTQFPREYSYMIGFATIFVAASIAFALVIQGFYKPQPLFQKARFADEIIGGILGLVQAAIIFGAVLIILDSFFRIPGIPADPNELPFLRDFWGGLNGSNTAEVFRDTLIPAFFLLTGLFVPDTIESSYPSL
jgi:membrane protein required for colicin V production